MTTADDETRWFAGVPWVLAGGLDVAGWEATPPTVTFADERVSGSTGCNRYTGSYAVDGDSLEIGTIASTRMACPPPADAVERAYLDALGRVTGWRSDGEALVLLSEEAELVRFAPAAAPGRADAGAETLRR
jgi:heat shock protein HslJ